ncbi:peptide MFS transporter [Shouchella patagoniensis]|uniref:peptide MFS transporter n=1 Tax=Shouchella patagoniensis TaxID=228576 RepID=UPI000995C3F7|nr:peptide MFS transporter [Shouchella patagoniensis]
MSSNNRSEPSIPQKGFFGHPKGLFTLFFTEFWERFSYYGMRAILLYYLYDTVANGGLGFDRATATAIVSIYGALVYMSGVLGGWLADRLFGTKKMVFYGGVIIMLGHIVLSIPGSTSAFFVSMILIILGTGLLKPNVSSVVGDLYTADDTRRDSGFSIFVMGINLGAFVAPLIVGTLGQNYNYHLGFAVAAVGMFIGLIVFLMTHKTYLGTAGELPPNPLPESKRKKVIVSLVGGGLIILTASALLLAYEMVTITFFINVVSILGVLLPIIYFIAMYRSKKTTSDEKSRLLAYIPLFVAAVMFWSIQEQGATILALYAAERTQLSLGSFTLQASWFQSLNPLFIIALAPIFAWLWLKLGSKQPGTPIKYGIGIIFAGASFLIMVIPAMLGSTQVSPLWLVFSFFLCVIGELLISPVGLSITTKLAPKAFSSQMMSMWFLTNACAQALNAQLAGVFDKVSEATYFGVLGGTAIILGLAMFALTPWIKRAMRGIQ